MELTKYDLAPVPRIVSISGHSENVFVSIQVGNGQIGGSVIEMNGEKIAKGDLSSPTFIGTLTDLKETEIVAITNVVDVNNFTNMCVITTSFLNENNEILYTKIDNGLAPENGVASFLANYRFLMVLLTILVASFMGSNELQGQEPMATFENLQTPASPGLILLDKAPSSIEKPTTPQGFGVGILGLFQGPGGAMEVAPFWLMNHPKLTAEKMFENKSPILYNFAISAATIKSDSSSFITGGIRTRLFQTYNDSITAALKSLISELQMALALLDRDQPDFSEIEVLQKLYTNLIGKPIFAIDFAAALGGQSVNNSFDNAEINRWAAWLSFNWRPKGNDFYVTVLTRYMNNENYETYSEVTDFLDLGARANYDISKFCLSVEYIQRIDLTVESDADYRIAAIGSYQLTDHFYFTTTFGKNFTDVNNIIALAGINFGVSKNKVRAY